MPEETKGPGQGEPEGDGTQAETAPKNHGKQDQGDESLTLTKAELQRQIDREVTKAIKTRTENLQRKLNEAEETLDKIRKERSEGSLTDQERAQAREREVEQAKATVKEAHKEVKRLTEEIEALVGDELDALCLEDRKIVEGAFPEDSDPLLKLKVLRRLKNAGKLSGPKPNQEESGPEDVGSRKRPVNPKVDSDFAKAQELGREMARMGRRKEEPFVPDAWKGR